MDKRKLAQELARVRVKKHRARQEICQSSSSSSENDVTGDLDNPAEGKLIALLSIENCIFLTCSKLSEKSRDFYTCVLNFRTSVGR